MASTSTDQKFLPTNCIFPSAFPLRPANKEDVSLEELNLSVSRSGILTSLVIRKGHAEIIDGHRRWICASGQGISEVPVTYVECDRAKAIALSLECNPKSGVTPGRERQALERIIQERPEFTFDDLCGFVSRRPAWIAHRLRTHVLDFELVTRLPLLSAYHLAKIPKAHREEFTHLALTLGVDEFVKRVTQFIAAYQKEVGRIRDETFTPRPQFRKFDEVMGAREGEGTWQEAIAWVLSLDPETTATKKARWEKRYGRKKA